MVSVKTDIKRSLEAYLQRTYPDRLEMRVAHIEELTDGWETTIYSLTVSYEQGGERIAEDLIVRFFQGPRKREQAQTEYQVMNSVRRLGIPVPQVYLLVTEHPDFDSAFIVMEKINGATLHSRLAAASEHEIIALINAMVAHFVTIHQLPWQEISKARPYGGSVRPEPLAFVESRLADMKQIAARYKLHEFEPLFSWLEERIGLGVSTELCLMHGDFHPQNILTREDTGELLVIDWSFAEIGDYRLDLAWTARQVDIMVGPHYREALLTSYESLDGRAVENLEYFEALKFTERMLTIATWLDESVVIPVKKISREAIRGDYKIHVLNVYARLKEVTGLELPTIENI
jgi:aminoglycoside phosphotransferase (APT) family kinase protein